MNSKQKFDKKYLARLAIVSVVFASFTLALLAPLYLVHTLYTNPKPAQNKVVLVNLDDISKEHDAMQVLKELKIQEQDQKEIQHLEDYLTQRGSNMAPYAGLIYDQVKLCGGDYRVLIAIAGNESNFGKVNYKLYNPFGYLNGVQYATYEEALKILSCKISQEYLVPCNNDLNCIISRYGGLDTNKEQWVKNIQYFINLF